jgi:hypothetical protein
MPQQVFRIPLRNTPQRFEIELAGRSFIMIVRWNPAMPNWVMCLLDGETESVLLNCLPFTTGEDLLSQFRHVGIEGSFTVVTDGDEFATPTLENLGSEANLYYVVDR